MVEERWDLSMVNSIIEGAEDPIEGAYHSVAYYDHMQLVNLVIALHKETQIPSSDLLLTYGRYLFSKLAGLHPSLVENVHDSLTLLENIEGLIHAEVKKLYPDANPPKFDCRRLDLDILHMTYRSHRSMGDVAEGLMQGCADHFGETIQIQRTNSDEDGTTIEFILTREANL